MQLNEKRGKFQSKFQFISKLKEKIFPGELAFLLHRLLRVLDSTFDQSMLLVLPKFLQPFSRLVELEIIGYPMRFQE